MDGECDLCPDGQISNPLSDYRTCIDKVAWDQCKDGYILASGKCVELKGELAKTFEEPDWAKYNDKHK